MTCEPIQGLEAYEATPEQNRAFSDGMSAAAYSAGISANPWPVSDSRCASWTAGYIYAYERG